MTPAYTEPIVSPVSAGEDDVRQYLNEIRQYPRLTVEQERELARSCAEGNEDAIRMIAQEYILSCTHQKDDTPVRAQTLVIMLRPQDVFKRALDIMTLCDEIETMVKVCGSCKIYR